MTLFVFTLSLSTFAKTNDLAVWGKIVKPSTKIGEFEYFVVYSKKGKDYAYPLDVKNYGASRITPFVNQFVRIEGVISSNKIMIEGQSNESTIIYPKNIKGMKLSDLSVGNYSPSEKALSKNLKKEAREDYRGGGFEISDKVANTTILTGAALLIGSMLLSQ